MITAAQIRTILVQGVFLDPNGPVSVTNTNIEGQVFGGDSHDFQYVSGSVIDIPPEPLPGPTAGGRAPRAACPRTNWGSS
jgi:hypothetical protein